MKCVVCNHENSYNTVLCEKCGADIYICEKTRSVAIYYYNEGIKLAKDRNLSKAADTLTKSIQFDKFNVNALNALGLVYFELGMIGSALKQWATSASYFKGGNLANVYLNRIRDNVKEMDKMNDAVKMYNKGLAAVAQGNDDVAIIQLRKAVELSPKLIDAKNLLAFAYARMNDLTSANHMIDAVLAYDIKNEKALSYKHDLKFDHQAASQPPQKADVKRYEQPTPKQINRSYNQKKGFPLSEVLSLLVGAGLALAVMYLLVVPAVKNAGDEEIDRLNSSITSMEESHTNSLADKDRAIEELKTENEELSAANNQMHENAVLLEKQQRLATAAAFNASGNLRQAAAVILDIDTVGLSDAEMSQYNSLREAVFPTAAFMYFNEGRAFFHQRRFDESRNSLNEGFKYGMTPTNAGDAHYFLGRMAEDAGNIEEARTHYTRTVHEFPRGGQYWIALSRLNALG
jgi:tetratricopeptide (TPR) repeat protein